MRCFCTVATWSHLRMARILAASLRQSGNPETLHVLVADAEEAELPKAEPGIVYHSLDEVRHEIPEQMPYYFDEFEMANGLRPFFLRKLFQGQHEKVIYLDSDIFPMAGFAEIWDQAESVSLLVTPHQLRPPPLHLRHTDEIGVVDQGVYNSGFSAWNKNPTTEQILSWMVERFPRYVFVDRARFMFGDQKLYPLIENYFPAHVQIHRKPWLNIAFWNAHERNVDFDGRTFRCEGHPVIFFHMSGYRRSHPELVCSYFNRQVNEEILKDAPWFREVLRGYTQLFDSIPPEPGRPYRFNRYRGIRLNRELRRKLFETQRVSLLDPAVLRSLLIHALKRGKRRIKKLLEPKMVDGTRNE